MVQFGRSVADSPTPPPHPPAGQPVAAAQFSVFFFPGFRWFLVVCGWTSLMPFRLSCRIIRPLRTVEAGIMWVRVPWRSRSSWRSRWPNRPWFPPWSCWPSDTGEPRLTLDAQRPWRSWRPILSRRTHVTFLALFSSWSRYSQRTFGPFGSYWSSAATGTLFTPGTIWPLSPLLSGGSAAPTGSAVSFAASDSNRTFWTRFTTVSFGSRWSRSPCGRHVMIFKTQAETRSGVYLRWRRLIPFRIVKFLMSCVWWTSTSFISSITTDRFLTSTSSRTFNNMFCCLSVSARWSSNNTVLFRIWRAFGGITRYTGVNKGSTSQRAEVIEPLLLQGGSNGSNVFVREAGFHHVRRQ